MRLFTGIPISPEASEGVESLLDRLRPAAQLRWTPPYNLHITTKFIGEWPDARLTDLIAVLNKMRPIPAFSVQISGVGWFPNPHAPKILFAGVRGDGVVSLAGETEQALEEIGIARDGNPFRPHLTLARIKDAGISLTPLRQAIAQLESTQFGSFAVTRFGLYLSTTGPSGSIYTQLAEIPLSQ